MVGTGQGHEDLSNLDSKFFLKYDKNIKGRLMMVNKMLDWLDFTDEINGAVPNATKLAFDVSEDGKLKDEYFEAKKSELRTIMERAYFPEIDI